MAPDEDLRNRIERYIDVHSPIMDCDVSKTIQQLDSPYSIEPNVEVIDQVIKNLVKDLQPSKLKKITETEGDNVESRIAEIFEEAFVKDSLAQHIIDELSPDRSEDRANKVNLKIKEYLDAGLLEKETQVRYLMLDIFSIYFAAHIQEQMHRYVNGVDDPNWKNRKFKEDNLLISSEGKVVILSKEVIRYALWGISWYTSMVGTANALSWLNITPNSEMGIVMKYLIGMSVATGVSQILFQTKKEVERIACIEDEGLFKSTIIAVKSRKAAAAAICALLAFDVGSNIYGIVDEVLGDQAMESRILELRGTITERKAQLESDVETHQAQLEESALNYSHKAIADEAAGRFSGDAGVGPRFYGQAALFYYGMPFDLNHTFTPEGSAYQAVNNSDGTWSVGVKYDQSVTSWKVGGENSNTASTPKEILSGKRGANYQAQLRQLSSFETRYDPPLALHKQYIKESNLALETMNRDLNRIYTQIESAINTLDGGMEPERIDQTRLSIERDSFHQIENVITAYNNDLSVNLAEVGEEYTRHRRAMIKAVASSGTISTENIRPPTFSELEFDTSQIEIDDFNQLSISEIWNEVTVNMNPFLKFLMGLTILSTALGVSHFDMAGIYWVKRAYQADEVVVKSLDPHMLDKMAYWLKQLDLSFNQGPFAYLHTARERADESNGVSRLVLLQALSARIAELSGEDRSVFEDGLFYGIASLLSSNIKYGLGADSERKSLLSEVKKLYKDGVDSENARVHNRFVRAGEKLRTNLEEVAILVDSLYPGKAWALNSDGDDISRDTVFPMVRAKNGASLEEMEVHGFQKDEAIELSRIVRSSLDIEIPRDDLGLYWDEAIIAAIELRDTIDRRTPILKPQNEDLLGNLRLQLADIESGFSQTIAEAADAIRHGKKSVKRQDKFNDEERVDDFKLDKLREIEAKLISIPTDSQGSDYLEFATHAFDDEYNKAIEGLDDIRGEVWSLNVSPSLEYERDRVFGLIDEMIDAWKRQKRELAGKEKERSFNRGEALSKFNEFLESNNYDSCLLLIEHLNTLISFKESSYLPKKEPETIEELNDIAEKLHLLCATLVQEPVKFNLSKGYVLKSNMPDNIRGSFQEFYDEWSEKLAAESITK